MTVGAFSTAAFASVKIQCWHNFTQCFNNFNLFRPHLLALPYIQTFLLLLRQLAAACCRSYLHAAIGMLLKHQTLFQALLPNQQAQKRSYYQFLQPIFHDDFAAIAISTTN